MQRRGKHTSVTIEELLGDGVFYVVRAKLLQGGQFESANE
jgi:hypothetical protein